MPKLAPAPDTAPERLETGTQNHEGIAGAAAAVEFLASLADGPTRRDAARPPRSTAFTSGVRRWLEQLWRGLTETPGVRLYGPPPSEPRTPTVSFTVRSNLRRGRRRLAAKGVFASHGDFYATTVVERLGRRRTAWCGSAAPATRPRRRSTGC